MYSENDDTYIINDAVFEISIDNILEEISEIYEDTSSIKRATILRKIVKAVFSAESCTPQQYLI